MLEPLLTAMPSPKKNSFYSVLVPYMVLLTLSLLQVIKANEGKVCTKRSCARHIKLEIEGSFRNVAIYHIIKCAGLGHYKDNIQELLLLFLLLLPLPLSPPSATLRCRTCLGCLQRRLQQNYSLRMAFKRSRVFLLSTWVMERWRTATHARAPTGWKPM